MIKFSNKNRFKDKLFEVWGIISTLIGIVLLVVFIGDIFVEGVTRIDGKFLKSLPSMFAEKAGVYPALMGSLWILFLTAIIAFPIGVGAGIYLEEYGKKKLVIFSFRNKHLQFGRCSFRYLWSFRSGDICSNTWVWEEFTFRGNDIVFISIAYCYCCYS
jgi:hypothetical protein